MICQEKREGGGASLIARVNRSGAGSKRCAWLWCIMAMAAASPACAEWRFSAGLGASYTRSSDIHIMQPNSDFTIEGVRWDGRSFEMPPYYELRLEHYPGPSAHVGYFAGLVHMKVYGKVQDVRHVRGTVNGVPVDTDAPGTDYVQMFDISHGVNFIELGVMVRGNGRPSPAFPQGRVRPYAGLAIGPVINHPENQVMGVPYSGQFRYGEHFSAMALAGVHYGLSHRWGLYAEAKATHIGDNEVSIDNGQAETTLDSLHAVFGASYSF